ncbi:MAG: RluA family pseudouridine synthase [Clostridia bacterium]|nr:RluA family pseudouridine synthase [Clostridia bacterium]
MTLEYIVKDNKYQSINQILKQEFHISTRLQNKLIKNSHVFQNDISVDTRNNVNINDVIKVNLDFEEESENIVSTQINLDIVFEDNCLLILNKPAGIAVHPSILHYEDSLSNGVKFYFESIGLKRKIRPVNRLDLNTSGLIIFAKNEYVQESLIQQMQSGTFKKEYIAIISGHLDEPFGTINLPIARKENSIIERCISPDGQEAITDYVVLKEYDNISVVKCSLKTGRTHQIRVHMAAIGHPLLGDTLYGSSCNLIDRQALHSCKICFVHPISRKNLEFVCDLPDDMKNVKRDRV